MMISEPRARDDDGVVCNAFEAVVVELEEPLGRFIAQMVADRPLAEDILQETFCAAWRAQAKMPVEPGGRRAWMYAIARNEALHALRTQRRARRASDALRVQYLRDDVDVEAVDVVAMHDLLIRTLRPQDRSLFLLRYVHGFSAPQLAAMTGLRSAAVRKRLERSAAALRVALKHSTSIDKEHSNV